MDLKEFQKLYEYVGGGYFRPRNVKKGNKADCLHGMEAIKMAMQLAYQAGRQDGFSMCEKAYMKAELDMPS